MTLLTRMTRLFRADLHAVLDRLEEPEALLRQAVRDMDDAVAETQRQLRRKRATLANVSSRAAELQKVLDDLEPELDICFEHDKPELARTLVRRKLQTTRLLEVVRNREQRLVSEIDTQDKALAARRIRLESTRQKADVLSNRARQSSADTESVQSSWTQAYDDCGWPIGSGAQSATPDETEVEVAFLKEQQRRKGSS